MPTENQEEKDNSLRQSPIQKYLETARMRQAENAANVEIREMKLLRNEITLLKEEIKKLSKLLSK